MALKPYVMTAIVLGVVAWLWVNHLQRAADQRQAVASQYSLGARQMVVYDKCISAMEHRVLLAGGSNHQFCGCLTKNGLSDLQQDDTDTVLGWMKNGLPEPAMVTRRQDRALEAAIACSEDTRSKWTSVAAMQSWCAEKDARRKLPQCKLDLK
jgi:hypothetical protein